MLQFRRLPPAFRGAQDGRMSAITARTALVALLPTCLAAGALAATLAAPASARDVGGDVTIYRCTGADGEVVIGNVPCDGGAEQQVRNMVRPVDGAPRPVVVEPPGLAPAPPPVIQYVVQSPPQALYECVRADGSTYESDTGLGDERWVPVWSGGGWPVGGDGYGGWTRGARHGGRGDIGRRGTTISAGNGLSAPPVSRISIPADPPRPDPDAASGPRPRPPRGGHHPGAVGGYVERDPCHVLPPAESCARLRDRRDDLRRRFFNAQQVERDTLRVEERGLNARIDRDCRTY